jgi:hypothetical protein
MGNYGCLLANSVSQHFNFTGPSMTIDTACSGTLTAVQLVSAHVEHSRHQGAGHGPAACWSRIAGDLLLHVQACTAGAKPGCVTASPRH